MERILVVDDDPIMRETIKDILLFEGFEVHEAADGNEAERILATIQPDLIITDILMPSRDGFEVINDCKKNYPGMKIIAISGGGYISPGAYLDMARDLGAHAIIGKPFDVDMLIETIKKCLDE